MITICGKYSANKIFSSQIHAIVYNSDQIHGNFDATGLNHSTYTSRLYYRQNLTLIYFIKSESLRITSVISFIFQMKRNPKCGTLSYQSSFLVKIYTFMIINGLLIKLE